MVRPSAPEIHRDPEREYSKYNYQTVCNKMDQARLWALHNREPYADEIRTFLESCDLDREPDEAEKTGSHLFHCNNNDLYFEIGALNAKISELTTSLVNTEAKTYQIAKEKLELQNKCEQVATDMQILQAEKKQLEGEKLRLQARCQELEGDKLRFQAEVKQAAYEKSELQRTSDQMGHERDKLKSENDHLKSTLKQELVETKTMLAILTNYNETELRLFEKCLEVLQTFHTKIEKLEGRKVPKYTFGTSALYQRK